MSRFGYAPTEQTAAHFHWHFADLGMDHVYIKARTLQLNGKVERSHRTDKDEFYQLLTIYSAAIGLLSAILFAPLTAGLWWKKANTAGGVASIAVGALVYLIVQFGTSAPKFSPAIFALLAGAAAMAAGAIFGKPPPKEPLVGDYGSSPGLGIRGSSVVLVDDHSAMIELLREDLEDAGFLSPTLPNAEQAMIQDDSPYWIIT